MFAQEAFKTIEDIHWLLNYSKKPPKPAVVANYYSKQSKVYLMAGNRLFHACACHRLFVLSRDQKKNLQQEELQRY
jgi:translation initiation factor 3 subunit A